MLKKIGIIIAIITILVACIFVYFSKKKPIKEITPTATTKTISGTTFVESGATENSNEWDPNVMKVGQPIQSKSGVTVTVSTNGPAVKAMTADELKEFQNKIQGK